MENKELSLIILMNAAGAAYNEGQNDLAAKLYQRAAERALESGQLELHVHCLRWTGNALMWAFRHDEAYPHLLQAISYESDPRLPPDEIYGGMTDLALVSLRSRPLQQTRELLQQIRDFLGRRQLTRWDHRLGRLESMLHLRRGEAQLALETATRAWQRRLVVTDGPRYQNGAYLDAIFRAAHQLGDVALMDQTLEWFRRKNEDHIVTSRIREKVCLAMRQAFAGVNETTRPAIESLAGEVLSALNSGGNWVREEGIDAVRLLSITGHDCEATQHLAAAELVESADSALLRLDLALCMAAGEVGWQLPFYDRDFANTQPPVFLCPRAADRQTELLRLLGEAGRLGQIEDARLECATYARAIAVRRNWLNPSPAASLPSTPAVQSPPASSPAEKNDHVKDTSTLL